MARQVSTPCWIDGEQVGKLTPLAPALLLPWVALFLPPPSIAGVGPPHHLLAAARACAPTGCASLMSAPLVLLCFPHQQVCLLCPTGPAARHGTCAHPSRQGSSAKVACRHFLRDSLLVVASTRR
jgi:hypothetical protein